VVRSLRPRVGASASARERRVGDGGPAEPHEQQPEGRVAVAREDSRGQRSPFGRKV
jgi:hypothetical protein